MTEEIVEEWRPVVGYEGLYEVSSLGRVRSLPRPVRSGRGAAPRITKLIIMGTRLTAYGYVRVTLRKNGKDRDRPVHRLVYTAFCGQVDRKIDIDHINGVRTDNRLCNLRTATRSQNLMNAKRRSDNTSGFKGVCRRSGVKRWHARLEVMGKDVWLGYFDTPEAAHAAYCEAARKHFGEFARFA